MNSYQRLAALLKGEAPRGLLPPAPRGYVATRLQQLAGAPHAVRAEPSDRRADRAAGKADRGADKMPLNRRFALHCMRTLASVLDMYSSTRTQLPLQSSPHSSRAPRKEA